MPGALWPHDRSHGRTLRPDRLPRAVCARIIFALSLGLWAIVAALAWRVMS